MDNADIQEEDLLDLNEVMRAFGVDEWSNLGPVASSQADLLSLLVEFQGQRYILRERPEGLLGEDDNHRYAFRAYLRAAGIPVPPLYRTPQGEQVVALGEDYFELQPWVEGDHFATNDPRSLTWVAAAGEMLGRLHQASRSYPGPEHRWPSEVQAGGLVQSGLNLARARADENEIQAIAAALSDWCDAWEAVLPPAMMSLGAGRGIPEFHIHGDYSALNLRFNDHGVSAVLGLEASRWEKRILELAYGVFYFSALAWNPESSLTLPLVRRGLDPERARVFLEAYGSIYPPVPGEALLLTDVLMLAAPIVTINGPLEDIFYEPASLQESLIDDVMERLNWATSLPAWLARTRRTLAEMWG